MRLISRLVGRLRHKWRILKAARWQRTHPLREADLRDEIIYDVGLHTGQDTEFYLKKGFRVVAIDANPQMTRRVAERFAAEVSAGRLVVLNVGVTDAAEAAPLEFFVNDRTSEWSSFIRGVAARDGGTVSSVKVPCRPLNQIVNEFGTPYYVKIDIEGYDVIALRSLLASDIKPAYLSVENGNNGMLQMLVDAGYTGFKFIQQRDVPHASLPKPAREGRYVMHVFAAGASGPFGEETTGEWIFAEAVRPLIEKVWGLDGTVKNPAHDDAIDGWFDLHARLGDDLAGTEA